MYIYCYFTIVCMYICLCRYVISVEGNDVATNLKWAMASNSVVIMPLPRVESYFGEGQLIPNIHFVPVKHDFSNLVDQIEICEKRSDKCRSVAVAGRQFALRRLKSLDELYEEGSLVLERHLRKIWNVENSSDIKVFEKCKFSK